MMLSQLIPDTPLDRDVLVNGISDDSRKMEEGHVFLAMPGLQHDGRAFIDDVAGRASAILCEAPVPGVDVDVPLIEIENLRMEAGKIASRFFGNPSGQMKVVAVTGTNGKTSVSNYIATAANNLGCPCGVIGTLGTGVPDALNNPGLTTPDAISMQTSLASLRKDGCAMIALEASSHGLAQGRLNGTAIDVAVFTNLTHDHLDYHESFETYLQSKQRLFEWPGLHTAVINRDDPHGETLSSVSSRTIFYGFEDADVVASSIELHADGLSFDLESPWGSTRLESTLIGRFNISNLLATVSVLGVLGFDLDDITSAVGEIRNVTGRMHTLSKDGLPRVVIDYAHTPDALANALTAVQEHCSGQLWCVFGCGGDRDKGKRSLMGSVAVHFSNYIVVTDDNPRNEDPDSIVNDIMKGIDNVENVEKISPRPDAIAYAINHAGEEDVILIAGKGHESYQEIRGSREVYSDFEAVRQCFEQQRTGRIQ